MKKFRDLSIGDRFDWISDSNIGGNSFFRSCQKVSSRCYQDDAGYKYEVGSINAIIGHVLEEAAGSSK